MAAALPFALQPLLITDVLAIDSPIASGNVNAEKSNNKTNSGNKENESGTGGRYVGDGVGNK